MIVLKQDEVPTLLKPLEPMNRNSQRILRPGYIKKINLIKEDRVYCYLFWSLWLFIPLRRVKYCGRGTLRRGIVIHIVFFWSFFFFSLLSTCRKFKHKRSRNVATLGDWWQICKAKILQTIHKSALSIVWIATEGLGLNAV